MNNFLNTVWFTFKNKVKSKFFLISTIIFGVLIIGGMNFTALKNIFTDDSTASKSATIIINNMSETFIVDKEEMEKLFPDDNIAFVDNSREAKKILNKNLENMMLSIEDNAEKIYDIKIYKGRHADASKISTLAEATKQLSRYSIMQQLEVDSIIQTALMAEPQIEYCTSSETSDGRMAIAYILTLAFMILLNFYVQGVAGTIVSEKNNRVIEVLLTSAKSTQLFFGKIVGNCMASIAQIVLLGIVGVGTYMISGVEPFEFQGISIDLSILTKGQLALVVVFFILGYLMYSLAAGALASFANNNDDLNQAILPVTICFMVSVVLAMAYLIYPNISVLNTLSCIPLFSPMVMIIRVVMADISNTAIIVNAVLLVMTIVAFSLIGSFIYSKGTLNDSKKLSFLSIFK